MNNNDVYIKCTCIMSSSARLILVICAYIFGLGDFQSDYSAIYMLFTLILINYIYFFFLLNLHTHYIYCCVQHEYNETHSYLLITSGR